MVKLLTCLLLSVCAQTIRQSQERWITTKRVDPGILHQELQTAGFMVNDVTCFGSRCEINLHATEQKDPSDIVAAHDPDTRAKLIATRANRIKYLIDRLRSGSATTADRDELLVLIATDRR